MPPAIARILPAGVAAAEIRGDEPDMWLHPAEEELVAGAVVSRVRTFTAARTCARRALAELGCPPVPILRGPHNEPLWPPGFVGSVTHCDGYRAAVAARAGTVTALGIDAEPHRPLKPGLVPMIATPAERDHLGRLPTGVHWDRLLFCVKESVYKAWFPLTGRWLDFPEAVVTIDPGTSTFAARILVPGNRFAGADVIGFEGGYVVSGSLVITAVTAARTS
jgi:4'-phosphopantetheinyl transferase EntD